MGVKERGRLSQPEISEYCFNIGLKFVDALDWLSTREWGEGRHSYESDTHVPTFLLKQTFSNGGPRDKINLARDVLKSGLWPGTAVRKNK